MSEESLKQKQAVIDEIRDKFDKSSSAVVIDYMGVTVAEANAMRTKLREAEVDYKVYKNTLVNRAIDGTEYEQIKEMLAGPSAFAFGSEDATAPARVLNGVMKEYKKMAFKAGIIDGVFYDAAGMAQIAEIPPRNDLIAKFLGSIQNPVGSFVRVLAAIADKDEDATAPGEEKAEAAAGEAPVEEKTEAATDEAPTEEKTEAATEDAPTEEKTEAAAEEAADAEAPAEDSAESQTEETTEKEAE
jgi:large subunit ribosomal protein L10